MNDDIDFSLVKQADIPTAHFARLCGVSRLSAHLWLKPKDEGGTTPRGLYRDHVLGYLRLVKKALEDGALPLPRTNRSARYDALVKALGLQ